MTDWTFDHFSVGYAQAFFQHLQRNIPVHLNLFLIVNPPPWFGKIWYVVGTVVVGAGILLA